MSAVLVLTQEVSRAPSAPVQPASGVFTAMREMEPSTAVVDPALKPNQPRKRMNTPRAASVRLWPGMGLGFPPLPNFPIRGPAQWLQRGQPILRRSEQLWSLRSLWNHGWPTMHLR